MDAVRPGAAAIAVGIVLVAVGSSIGGAVSLDSAGGSVESGGTTQVAPANDTVRHENPAAVDQAGDLDAVSAWLADRLTERLSNSTRQLNRGEYERAREVLGEEYRERLDQYLDVAGETGSASDDRAAERLRAARETQREFVAAVETYERTLDAYRRARERGNETAARELARQLFRAGSTINHTGTSLADHYRAVGNLTGRELGNATRRVVMLTENATGQVAAVQRDLFVETRLRVSVSASRLSFDEPATVTGTIVTSNGTPLASRVVRVRIGGQVFTPETDATGRFRLAYRPVFAPAGRSNLTVAFVPRNEPVYLGASDSVSVTIEPVEPAMRASVSPGLAGFGERVRVAGRVGKNGSHPADVPIAVALDGRRLAVGATDAEGRFSATFRVPAWVPPGRQPVRVAIGLRDRAIAATALRRSIRVGTTDTSLSAAATAVTEEEVRLVGRLVTADGTPVANRSIDLLVAGSPVTTVRTNPTGFYTGTLPVPEDSGRALNLTVAFDGGGTNLAASRAAVRVELPGASARGPVDWLGAVADRWWPAWLVGGVGLLIAVVAWFRRDRVRRILGGRPSAATDEPAGVDRATERHEGGGDATDVAALGDLERFIEAGAYDAAVGRAYGLVRARLARRVDDPGPFTHWEFLQTCRSNGLGADDVAVLERLTEAYERSTFAPGPTDRASAVRAVEAATALLGSE